MSYIYIWLRLVFLKDEKEVEIERVLFLLTFEFLYLNIHVLGYGVPVGFFAGFSFIPPLGKTAAWAVAVGPFSQTRGLSDLSPAL